MRITYIHQYFTTMDSAGGVRSYIFSKYLVSKGHKVTVITSDNLLPAEYKGLETFSVYGIDVIVVKTSYSTRLDFFQRVWAFIKFMILSSYLSLKTSPDLIYATSTPLTVAVPGLVVKFIKRIPFVFEVRDMWPDVPIELGIIKNKLLIYLLKLFEKLSYRFADKIICISEGIMEKISAPAWKKEFIPIGCDLELFNGIKNSRWKQVAGVKDGTLFVFTGAIGIANCLEYLMDAAKRLKSENEHEISIAIIGEGSAKKEILLIKEKYQLDNVLIFDSVPKKILPGILAAADGGLILHGISPTYRETASPNKFYDYIAAGIPVIFNFQGPLKDLILEERAGYYVDSQSPKHLADVLIHISRNRSEALEFGNNARHLAEKRFDLKNIVVLFEDVLTECHKSMRY